MLKTLLEQYVKVEVCNGDFDYMFVCISRFMVRAFCLFITEENI